MVSIWPAIQNGSRVIFIAEAGVNHNGNFDMAVQLIEKAADAGADAIKFQTFSAEKLVSPLAGKADYQKETTGETGSQFDMLRELELPYADFEKLNLYCRDKDIAFLSSPFDEESADFLDEIGMEIYKIPSGELTNIPLLKHIARKNKPMIISTGMAREKEIVDAIKAIHNIGNSSFALLHCVSSYPAPPQDINLNAMLTLKSRFQVPVGFSDHSIGDEIPIAAVAMGAVIIEKHMTLDRGLPGPDHRCSLDAGGIQQLIAKIRNVERAIGDGHKRPAPSERNVMTCARKSLFSGKHISAGQKIKREDINIRRPGTGLSPGVIDSIVGKRAIIDIHEDTMLKWEMFQQSKSAS